MPASKASFLSSSKAFAATLLPGCDVANNCIVGAAAVVTKSIEQNSACAGNPAVVIKRDIDWDRDIPPEEINERTKLH